MTQQDSSQVSVNLAALMLTGKPGKARIGAPMTDSNILDLYEEMLQARAEKGLRPVLYVSSHIDLKCSVRMLLNESPELAIAGRYGPPRSSRFGRRIRII